MKIKGEYMLREIAGETVAVPVNGTVLGSNVLVVLNETAAFLWKMLTKGCTEDEITAAVCGEYDVDAETAKKDLREFTEYLKNHKVEIE